MGVGGALVSSWKMEIHDSHAGPRSGFLWGHMAHRQVPASCLARGEHFSTCWSLQCLFLIQSWTSS